jgi:periplasmic divalent cation tolerance protein
VTDDLLRVTTVTPHLHSAKKLALTAVAAGLAGNAHIAGPVISVAWQIGDVGEVEAFQVTLSTTRATYPALEAHLRRNHPSENPEITAVALAAAPEAYARWLRESAIVED